MQPTEMSVTNIEADRKEDRIMILKILYQDKGEGENVSYDRWDYYDNIRSASNYYDRVTEQTVAHCFFNDGTASVFAIPVVAYLMSDDGKTIERLYRKKDPKECAAELERLMASAKH